MERMRFSWFVLFLIVLATGCDQGSSASKAPPPPSADGAKGALADMANSGKLGSSAMTVDNYIAEVRKTDPAKADALAKEFSEVRESSGKPDTFKAKAKELATKM